MNRDEIKLKIFLGKFLKEKNISDELNIKLKELSYEVNEILINSVNGLDEEIKVMYELYDDVDNIRFADITVEEDIEYYYYLQKQGCCGFFDEQINISGKTYLIGCNYGH